MDLTEIEAALLIDKHDLDTELLSQADLFYRVAQEYTKAVSIKDEAYELMKETDANLNLSIREAAEQAQEKITEAKISATVLSHDQHSQIFSKWLNAKEESDKLGHLKEAFIQRSYMLRDLAQLYIAGYYSEKSVSAENVTSKDAVYKKRKERMRRKRLEKQ